MSWRVAESLNVLLDEVNTRAPKRSKASDGSIGDPAHASRASDHNPNSAGVVTARDFTHDPDANADMHMLAAFLQTGQDRRIKYVIWNRRIMSGRAGPSPWQWRPYTGTNPHDKHLHVSVVSDSALNDSTKPWGWTMEDDMPLTDKDVERIAAAVWAVRYRDPDITAKQVLGRTEARTERLIDMVEALADGDTAGAKKTAAAVRKELARALEE